MKTAYPMTFSTSKTIYGLLAPEEKRMTFKLFVSLLCKREAKKRQVNIAQMSEIAHHVFQILGSMKAADAAALIAKYGRTK